MSHWVTAHLTASTSTKTTNTIANRYTVAQNESTL